MTYLTQYIADFPAKKGAKPKSRLVRIYADFAEMEISPRVFCQVDLVDIHFFGKPWIYSHGYAILNNRPGPALRLHSEILNIDTKLDIDHKDGNKLNNRRSNLRLATRTQNLRNNGLRKDSLSGFKGVTKRRRKQDTRWGAYLNVDGKQLALGTFSTAKEAAHSYDEAAIQYFGEYARTNKMMGLL